MEINCIVLLFFSHKNFMLLSVSGEVLVSK